MAMPSRSRQLSDWMASIPKSKGKKSQTLDSEEIKRNLTRLLEEFESLRRVQRLSLTDEKLIKVRDEIAKIMPALYQITNSSGPPYPSKRLVELREMSEKCLRRFKVDLDSLRPKPPTGIRHSAVLTSSTSALDSSLSSANKTSNVMQHSQPYQSHDLAAQVQQQAQAHMQQQQHHHQSARLSAELPPRIPTQHARPPNTVTTMTVPNIAKDSPMVPTKQIQQLQSQPLRPLQNGMHTATPSLDKLPLSHAHHSVQGPEHAVNGLQSFPSQQKLLQDIHEMLSNNTPDSKDQHRVWLPPSTLSPKEFSSKFGPNSGNAQEV